MAHQSNKLFELLKKDHRHAEQLMIKVSAASSQQRQEAFITLRNELQAHFRIEEKFFYPKLRPITDMKALVEDALDEHEEAKDLLARLDKMGVAAENWQETFEKLEEGIKHHLEDEEPEIFPKCTQFISSEELTKIAAKCIQEKEHFFSRTASVRGTKKSTGKEARP